MNYDNSQEMDFRIETEKYVNLGLNKEVAEKFEASYLKSRIEPSFYGLILEQQLIQQREQEKDEEKRQLSIQQGGAFSMQDLMNSVPPEPIKRPTRRRKKSPTMHKHINKYTPKKFEYTPSPRKYGLKPDGSVTSFDTHSNTSNYEPQYDYEQEYDLSRDGDGDGDVDEDFEEEVFGYDEFLRKHFHQEDVDDAEFQNRPERRSGRKIKVYDDL